MSSLQKIEDLSPLEHSAFRGIEHFENLVPARSYFHSQIIRNL